MRSRTRKAAALVPTMGALHEGHLSLIRAATATSDEVVVSIFVNPTQFGPSEDFARYPRNFERDAAMVEAAGATTIFKPSVEEMYPHAGTTLHVPEVTKLFEGKARPGHFDGVATVVCKLFEIVQPREALFGLKDLQQCVVIKRMVDDLNLAVRLHFLPTVREADGLAMSSRNAYLSEAERKLAPTLFAELSKARELLLSQRSPKAVLSKSRRLLIDSGFAVDYFALVNLRSFHPTSLVGRETALVTAATLGKTRLIDNVLLFDRENVP